MQARKIKNIGFMNSSCVSGTGLFPDGLSGGEERPVFPGEIPENKTGRWPVPFPGSQ
jgi:hypothetical protein